MAACAADPSVTRTPVAVLRAQLRGCLDDWHEFLGGNVAEARPLLDLVPADRIGFTPTEDRGYELKVPIAFDRVLTAVMPGLEGLQDRMASHSTPSWNQLTDWFQQVQDLERYGLLASERP